METIRHNGKRVGFCRLGDDLLYINPIDVPDSDRCIVEDEKGFRYLRNIPLTMKAQELGTCDGFIFKRL